MSTVSCADAPESPDIVISSSGVRNRPLARATLARMCIVAVCPTIAAAHNGSNLGAHCEMIRHWFLSDCGAGNFYMMWRYVIASVIATAFLVGLRCTTILRPCGTGTGPDDVPHREEDRFTSLSDVTEAPPLVRSTTVHITHLYMIMVTRGRPDDWFPARLSRVRSIHNGDLGVVRFTCIGTVVHVDVWLETPRR